MEGNPQKGPENSILGFSGENMYAEDFRAKLREHHTIIKDAEKLLSAMGDFDPDLQPKAISKVVTEQKERIKKAEEEIAKIQKENERDITKHMQ